MGVSESIGVHKSVDESILIGYNQYAWTLSMHSTIISILDSLSLRLSRTDIMIFLTLSLISFSFDRLEPET